MPQPPSGRLTVSWASTRVATWTPQPQAEGGLIIPLVRGVCCTMFAIGVPGTTWLGRLTSTSWYQAVQARSVDVRAGERDSGEWCPSAAPKSPAALSDDVEQWVAAANLPRVALATLALPADGDAAEIAVARGLARGLRQRVDPHGRPTAVVATWQRSSFAGTDVLKAIQGVGAFVVRGSPTVLADLLHSFPARAVTRPPDRELVGVDLRDHLDRWLPGGTATLHRLPMGFDPDRTPWPPPPFGRSLSAVHLYFHTSGATATFRLSDIDRLAASAQAAYRVPSGGMLFTSRARPDGVEGTADLLLVQATS